MNRAYIYAKAIATGKYSELKIIETLTKEYVAPRYVKLQCQDFCEVWEGKNKDYKINEKNLQNIEKLLKAMYMPKIATGLTIYDALADYQWLILIATFCVVRRDNEKIRRYQTILLEVARKNFKTFTIAIIFIIAMILEPKFSRLYSVAPDGKLSREVKDAIDGIIKSSSILYGADKNRNFKILRDSVRYILKDTEFIPLNYTNSKFDGKQPNVFLADEVGALPNGYAINAMESGQIQLSNKLGCIISTKYPTDDNPFEDRLKYSKAVLDGNIQDNTIFSLIYEPDETKGWETNDLILMQANPAVIEKEDVYNELKKKRLRATQVESERENFLTKHCNIIYQAQAETYVNIEHLKKCKVEKVDFTGREVYVGVDLAMSNDNCSVAIVAQNEDKILVDSYAFIPASRVQEKIASENVDYIYMQTTGKCIACGDMTIDYATIEDFVFNIEKRFECKIKMIGYDRYNAISSAKRWDTQFVTVDVKQHSSILHPTIKLLSEKIENGLLEYSENKLLEINFQNCRCTYDTNLNRYLTKKKSVGKIDMVMAIVDGLYLLNENNLNTNDWGAQF